MAAKGEAKLLYPGLAGFYSNWNDIAYTLVRIVIGAIYVMRC